VLVGRLFRYFLLDDFAQPGEELELVSAQDFSVGAAEEDDRESSSA